VSQLFFHKKKLRSRSVGSVCKAIIVVVVIVVVVLIIIIIIIIIIIVVVVVIIIIIIILNLPSKRFGSGMSERVCRPKRLSVEASESGPSA